MTTIRPEAVQLPSVFVVSRSDEITEVKCVKRTKHTYTTLDHLQRPQIHHRETWSSRAFDSHSEAVRYMIDRAEDVCARAERDLAVKRKVLQDLKLRYSGKRSR